MPRCVTCGRRWVSEHRGCPATEAPSLPAPAELVEPVPGFRLIGRIGRGGFGVVVEGRSDHYDSPVAIKIAEPGRRSEALRREANVLRAIGMPFVPSVREVGALSSGGSYLVMEFVRHQVLAHRLGEISGPMQLGEFLSIAQAILETVGVVHGKGFIHCDLKPENIFVLPSPPGAKLIDFGVAQRLASGVQARSHGIEVDPITGALRFGTAEYMSPEQWADGQSLDERSDVYSIGVILYEMLTGRVPFWGRLSEVKDSHLSRRPMPPSKYVRIPLKLEQLVLRCLAKHRERRFSSVGELKDQLTIACSVQSESNAQTGSGLLHTVATQPAAASKNARRSVALLYIADLLLNIGEAEQIIRSTGGQLAHATGDRAAAVFDQQFVDNPIQRALRAANILTERTIVSRAVIDIAPVMVRPRPDGSFRYLSGSFARTDTYPRASDPTGTLITAAVQPLLPEISWAPVAGRDELFSQSGSGESATAVTQRPLFGRNKVLSALLNTANCAFSEGRPSISTIIGEKGLGKSRLARALINEVKGIAPNAIVIKLPVREPMDGALDENLRVLIRRALRLPSSPDLRPKDGGRSLLVHQLGQLGETGWPVVSLALGWIDSMAAELQQFNAASGVLRSMLKRVIGEALQKIAASAPLCLILDDTQWADDTTLGALEIATLAEARARIWLCAFGMPTFAESRLGWAERAGFQEQISLSPLDSESSANLLRHLLVPAENIPAEAITRLAIRTHGVPFLMAELARGLRNDGLIRKHSSGETWYLATDELSRLPDLPVIEWLAERQLGSLPTDLSAHVRFIATLGSEFSVDEIDGVMDELEQSGEASAFPLDARVATEHLVRQGILVAHRDQALTFRNSLLRDAAAQAMPPPIKETIHLAAFRFYQRDECAAHPHRVSRLAFHAGNGGLRSEAAKLYLELAEHSRSRHLYLDSEGLYSRALSYLNGTGRSELIAHRGRGLMRYRLGRYDDSVSDFERARELAQQLGDVEQELEILLDHATARDWSGQFTTSRKLVEDAQGRANEFQKLSPLLECRILLGIGRSQWRFNRWEDAVTTLTRARDLSERLGDAGYETHIVSLLILGCTLPCVNRASEAEEALNRVIRICERNGDRLHLGAALNNRRFVWTVRKDVENAIRDQQKYIQIARELGLVGRELNGEGNIGELLYQAGDLAAARRHVRRAADLEERHPEAFPRPWRMLLQARVFAYEGRLGEAQVTLDKIQRAVDRAASEGRIDGTMDPSFEVLSSVVRFVIHGASDSEWDALIEQAKKQAVDQELIEVIEMRGVAALRQGERERARQIFHEALRAAEQIPNIMEARIRRNLELTLSHDGRWRIKQS